MSPRLRTILHTVAVSLVAVAGGYSVAQGSLAWIALVSGCVLLLLLSRLLGLDADAMVAGAALFGYIVGNRGFAQVSPPGLPLFPAEALLVLGLGAVGIRRLRRGAVPLLRDGLTRLLALWIALCAIRAAVDFRTYGFLALRDFAVAYYALFYFLALDWAERGRNLRWIGSCLLAGLAGAPAAFLAFNRYPDFFDSHLLVGSAPLIFIKVDSAAPIMAGGAAWCACRALLRRERLTGLLAAALFGCALTSNSRAAMVGLLVAAVWFIVAGAWRILKGAAATALLGGCLLLVVAAVGRDPWHETEVYRIYERTASMADFSGTRTYQSEALQDKGDNNEFRMVWWRTVVNRAWTDGRWLGLGFGYDLTEEFTRDYFPSTDEDFSVRSPHNVLLTLFARTGLVGLSLFLVIVGEMAVRTWRRARAGLEERLGLELFAWSILVSACFGVVLEGPMGAVVFWIVLGLAHRAQTGASSAAAPAALEAGRR